MMGTLTPQPKTLPEITPDKNIPQLIRIEKIHPNTYNPNVMPDGLFQEVLEDIRQNGFIGSIIVRRKAADYEIIDGEHRYRAAQHLGYKELPCIIFDTEDDQAKILTFRWNHERGFFDTIKTSALIHDLNKRYSLEELRTRLGVAEEEMVQYLKPSEIPASWNTQIPTTPSITAEDREALIFFVSQTEKQEILQALSRYQKTYNLDNRNKALYHLTIHTIHSQSEEKRADAKVQRHRRKNDDRKPTRSVLKDITKRR